jgi:hypothetical protein
MGRFDLALHVPVPSVTPTGSPRNAKAARHCGDFKRRTHIQRSPQDMNGVIRTLDFHSAVLTSNIAVGIDGVTERRALQ